MIEFRHLPSFNSKGEETFASIASGPVIIKDNKVLLDKHGDDGFWKFPGGALDSDINIKQNAIKEVKEELGLDVELISEPYIITWVTEREGKQELFTLIHYLANILAGEPKLGSDIDEFAWHDIDNLPEDCAPNIAPVVEYFKQQK